MKMPSKGTPVRLRNGGTPIFAGGRNLDEPEEATVLLKYEGGKLDEGYGRGIVEISYDEFKDKRVYPQQLSSSQSITDIVTPNEIRTRIEDKLSD